MGCFRLPKSSSIKTRIFSSWSNVACFVQLFEWAMCWYSAADSEKCLWHILADNSCSWTCIEFEDLVSYGLEDSVPNVGQSKSRNSECFYIGNGRCRTWSHKHYGPSFTQHRTKAMGRNDGKNIEWCCENLQCTKEHFIDTRYVFSLSIYLLCTYPLFTDNFGSCWKNLLAYIEYVAGTDNSEMSLAALKNFQELLFGRGQSVVDGKSKNRYF